MGGSQVKNNAALMENLEGMVQSGKWQQQQWRKIAAEGLPINKDDAWKYTSLSGFKQLPLHSAVFQPVENISYESLSLNLDGYRLVFFDGLFSVRCSDWIPKITITPLDRLSDVETYELSKSVQPDAFTYLTDATATGGVLIEVDAETVIDKPIYLLHISSGMKGDVCSYRHHISLGRLSQCELIEHHISLDQGGGVTLSRMSADVGKGAHFYHTKLIEEAPCQHHFGHNDIVVDRDASVHSHCLMLSGVLCRHQTSSHLQGENGFIEMNSLSMPDDQQTFDSRTYLRHQAPHCRSEQLHKTIARGASNGVFDGMIYVEPSALKTDGQMDSHNLLLSESAQVNCKPQLEIYADDVKCSHGATTGQLDARQVDYMRARGISKDKAQQMLLFAFASEVAFKIRNGCVKQHVCDKLVGSLSQVRPHSDKKGLDPHLIPEKFTGRSQGEFYV
ncbi:Fe-S cluster assembly protein SufD [Photobacterium swingsii]|uniref:Fe-S cluster assembly protein SufD n=1 Tax=Photobacterium swingsii TaxID=680026 RepID=A0A2T3P884_9GAMM|nr:Fe-S cluster assembly protein SufD [Photobacterium swingsii]PSW24926.1 Fe-S cluster assembly protein SufD [Photobacterium swingsii]